MSLTIRNHQQVRAVNTPLLRRLTQSLLKDHLKQSDYLLGINLVSAKKMSRINEAFLQHTGSTDVITFDYNEGQTGKPLCGEMFICLNDAVAQAKDFNTTWQSELARYVIHGLLHLSGYDDLQPALRREMKREESRLLKALSKSFPLSKLALRSNRKTS